MTESISKFIKFPCGSRTRPYMIAGISLTEDGVDVSSSGGDKLASIKCPKSLREKVADVIGECCDAGKDFTPPDWAFLTAKASK